MQREGANSGEFQQTSTSDDGQFLLALRKLVKKEIDNAVRQELPILVVDNAVRQALPILVDNAVRRELPILVDNAVRQALPILVDNAVRQELPILVDNAVRQALPILVDNAVRQAVKEEIQSALSGGIRNCANEMTVSRERSLQLKFSDEVCLPVLTGKVLLGKTGNPMMVSLIDSTTGEVVDCEPDSSAKVEMLLLDANDDDRGSNWSVEDFNNRIISEDNKEKPHLAKNDAKYIHLKKGVGTLCKLKLGHGQRWMKNCTCRLAARVVENFRGNEVKEAEVKEAVTESFVVSDSRSKLYGKHHPPLLSDEVWRLENIGKDGAPCQHLNEGNIRTVQDFLFLHNVDPQALQQIFRVRADPKTWKETVDHARRCNIDDEKKLYLHQPCAEPEMSVVFDAVGGLKGLVVNQSHYAPIENLSADEKECAHKLLLSAFKNREERTSFDDEAFLLHQFPYRPSDPMNIAENINHYFPTEPAGSCITSYIMTSDLYNPSMDINGDAPTDPSSSSQIIHQSGSLGLNESIPRARDALLLSPSCQLFSYSETSSVRLGFRSPRSPTTGLLFGWNDATSLNHSYSPDRVVSTSSGFAGFSYTAELWVVGSKRMHSGKSIFG